MNAPAGQPTITVGGFSIDLLVQGFPGKTVCHGGLGWSTVALVRGQGRVVLVDAGNFGMRRVIAERLSAHNRRPLVLDPVMIAKSGDPLLQPEARAALIAEALPLAEVVTPNLHEAAALADMAVDSEADMEEAARRIRALGPRNVLVKGGHLKDAATDILWDGRAFRRYTAPRLDSPHTHGTGCTLSAAIAAGLARGRALGDAVEEAKRYVTAAIAGGFQAGLGVGALRHFVERW